MANFPTTLPSFTTKTSGQTISEAHVNSIQDEVVALGVKAGVDGSAVTTTHDYKLSGVTGTDKAVSKTGSEALTNKTLTSPVLNTGASGTAIKDEDDMASDSASHLATQQSIKAYVASQQFSLEAGTQLFSNHLTAANTFQDLDIGATIADLANGGLVFLEISCADADVSNSRYVIKPKGYGSATFSDHYNGNNYPSGIEFMVLQNPSYFYTMVVVDSSGNVQHACIANDVTVTIKCLGYIKASS